VKTLQLDFIKCIIPKFRTFKHFLAFLPDAYLATKLLDMSGKNLTYGNPTQYVQPEMKFRSPPGHFHHEPTLKVTARSILPSPNRIW